MSAWARRTVRFAGLVVLLGAGCATQQRAELGHFEIWALHPAPATLGGAYDVHYHLKVEDRRVVGIRPSESAPAEFWLGDDGCVNYMYRGRRAAPFCPAPPTPGPVVFVGPKGFSFATEIRDSGKTLRLIEGGVYVDLELPDGPAGDEVRKHPELVGLVIRLSGLPPSTDGRYTTRRPQ